MIDPKELRLGNYVKAGGVAAPVIDINRWMLGSPGSPYRVFVEAKSPDSGKTMQCGGWCEGIDPIPITDAVLEACCAGWEGRKCANFFDCTVSSLCVWYDKSEEGWLFLSADIGVEGVVVNVGPISLKGKYLHQLQNLYYALTGSELDIDGDKLAEAIKE